MALTLAFSRAVLLRTLVTGVVVAGGVLLLLIWSKNHDAPISEHLAKDQTITYKGIPLKVTIECTCPKALIISQPKTLSFTIHIKSAASSTPALPAVPGDVYVNWSTSDTINLGIVLGSLQDLLLGQEIGGTLPVKIAPTDPPISQITFYFASDSGNPGAPVALGFVPLAIESQPRFVAFIFPYALSLLACVVAMGAYLWIESRIRQLRERTEQKLAAVKEQADNNPEKARFAWDLARAKLEAYFDRNLLQVNLVFWVAVFVMVVGFGFVLCGVALSYSQPKITPATLVAAISGIVTQFIGATFMVIYRSTMAQANDFMTVLERINTVGMSVQVLDSLPENTELKNSTRANLALLLLQGGTWRKTTPALSPVPVKRRRVTVNPPASSRHD
ncbi:MAG: TRADD-N-associated membrane domain-containing protein [Bryobacteraceae bacterium]